MSCGNSLFGPVNQYIKTNTGDFVAVEGSSTRERFSLSDLRIPYKQIIKGRVVLKAGQTGYPLNHLGLGDNATFLSLKVNYDPKSKFEFDNYIQWNYFDDFSKIYPVSNLLVLSGNSTNRIKQIYLHNPNPNYSVSIDAMIAVIDDNTSIFTDKLNQSGLSFNDLKYTDIKTHIVDESIVIYSSDEIDLIPVPICYITIDDLKRATISKNGKILTLSDISVGSIYLDFVDNENAKQGFSLLQYVKNTPNAIIQELNPVADNTDPIIRFKNLVYLDGSPTYSKPYDTTMATTFSATMSFGIYASGSNISKDILVSSLIDDILDNRDNISLNGNSILIYDGINERENIVALGTYSIHFNIIDLAENSVDSNKNIQLYII
jgi:hypothetical protein